MEGVARPDLARLDLIWSLISSPARGGPAASNAATDWPHPQPLCRNRRNSDAAEMSMPLAIAMAPRDAAIDRSINQQFGHYWLVSTRVCTNNPAYYIVRTTTTWHCSCSSPRSCDRVVCMPLPDQTAFYFFSLANSGKSLLSSLVTVSRYIN